MTDEPSFIELLTPGENGDTPLTIKLTARQVAALQLVVSVGLDLGVGHVATVATDHHGVGGAFRMAYQEAELRLGLVLANTFSPGRKNELSAMLATLGQEKAAALDEGGG